MRNLKMTDLGLNVVADEPMWVSQFTLDGENHLNMVEKFIVDASPSIREAEDLFYMMEVMGITKEEIEALTSGLLQP